MGENLLQLIWFSTGVYEPSVLRALTRDMCDFFISKGGRKHSPMISSAEIEHGRKFLLLARSIFALFATISMGKSSVSISDLSVNLNNSLSLNSLILELPGDKLKSSLLTDKERCIEASKTSRLKSLLLGLQNDRLSFTSGSLSSSSRTFTKLLFSCKSFFFVISARSQKVTLSLSWRVSKVTGFALEWME